VPGALYFNVPAKQNQLVTITIAAKESN
jgi:hypothetical protein